MDDVLDHIRTLHDSRDIHGYLSLLVSTRWERVFDMRWKENGYVYKGGKKGHKVALPPEHRLSSFRRVDKFCREEPCFLFQCCLRKSKKEDGTAQWYLISEKSLQ